MQRDEILSDSLPEGSVDLIHTCALLCHLPEPERALGHIVATLKPGGWLLVEEPDFVTEHPVSTDNDAQVLFRKVTDAKAQLDKVLGCDAYYGRRVLDALRRHGMRNVAAEGRAPMTAGASPMPRFWTVSLMQIHDTFLAAGEVTDT